MSQPDYSKLVNTRTNTVHIQNEIIPKRDIPTLCGTFPKNKRWKKAHSDSTVNCPSCISRQKYIQESKTLLAV